MTWNFRLVDESEEDFKKIKLQEVYYNADGSPSWYSDCFQIQGETFEEAQEIISRMNLAFTKPILNKKDFNNG